MSTPSLRRNPEAAPLFPLGAICARTEGTKFTDIRRNVAVLTAAYLLDFAGFLDDEARRRIERLDTSVGRSWHGTVENIYGLDRAFLQNLYAVLLDSFLPHDAMVFILRGLDVPDPTALLEAVLSLNEELFRTV